MSGAIALVIGVGAYQNAPHLANPVNDARAIGDSLRRLNFDVTELYDPDFRALNSGMREFGIRAASADVAVVYYAGHGVQVDRENYLIPPMRSSNASATCSTRRCRSIGCWARSRRRAGSASSCWIAAATTRSSNGSRVDDRRRSRGVDDAGPGAGGQRAAQHHGRDGGEGRPDRRGRRRQHSPFAAALLAHFQIPGLELSLFFRSVRDTVLRATNNRQEPYHIQFARRRPFYFYPRPPNRPPEIAAIPPLEVTETAGPTPLRMPQPTDPDQDPLTVRIIGLPRFGEVRIEGQPVAPECGLSPPSASRRPPTSRTARHVGPAGTLDILVEDGRGGSVTGSLPITVRSSHHAAGGRRRRVGCRSTPAALGIHAAGQPGRRSADGHDQRPAARPGAQRHHHPASRRSG